mgnify:FL=1
MNRKLLLLALVLLTCLGVKAQGATAMLQSGEKFSVFYGPDALQQAYDAATDGDAITLSVGTFTPLSDNMQKQLKITGASAFEENSNTNIESMTISANDVQIEGIKFTSKLYATLADNLIIKHCYVETLTAGRNNNKTLIDQCGIAKVEMMKFFKDFTFKNSTIGYFSSDNTNASDNIGNITNCVIYNFSSGKTIKAIYRNNIFCVQGFSQETIECAEPSEFYNNFAFNISMLEAGIWATFKFSDNCINVNNTNSGDNVILEDRIQRYPAQTKNEPTGDDGTKIGIYGGTGFTSLPSIPSVTEKYIDLSTNEDGKIHVELKAKVNK